MATIGKNQQDKKVYDTINDNKDYIIDEIKNSNIDELVIAMFNFFDTDDINSFIEELHETGVIYIDELE